LGALALCAALLSGCAYQTETMTTAANDTVTSYSAKVPGKWIVYVEASALNQVVRPSDMQCAAHTSPRFHRGFAGLGAGDDA
jgi:hypothetical protein